MIQTDGDRLYIRRRRYNEAENHRRRVLIPAFAEGSGAGLPPVRVEPF